MGQDSRLRPTEQLHIVWDERKRILWESMRAPVFYPELLAQMTRLIDWVEEQWETSPATAPLVFATCGSAHRIFNLGGDLDLFLQHIKNQDLEGMIEYGLVCARGQARRLELPRQYPMKTVALVEGPALGGGFECALAHEVIVATTRAKFALPECLFGLVPGAGGYSILLRLIGRSGADELVSSGRVYDAWDMQELGVVTLVPDGMSRENMLRKGLEVIDRADHEKATTAHRTALHGRTSILQDELEDIARYWACEALRVSERNQRLMSRLVQSQRKRLCR